MFENQEKTIAERRFLKRSGKPNITGNEEGLRFKLKSNRKPNRTSPEMRGFLEGRAKGSAAALETTLSVG